MYMLHKVSKNGVGLVLLILTLIGLDVPEKMVEDIFTGVFAAVSLGLMIWNQVKRHDVAGFLFRK